jgi:pimeloyl-ACP methyl ester carboxylesterase
MSHAVRIISASIVILLAFRAEARVFKTVVGVGGLKSIEVPLNDGSADSLEVHYQIVAPGVSSEKNGTTLVVLPGGPEATLEKNIKDGFRRWPSEMPKFVMDYRGFGVNAPVDMKIFESEGFKDFNTTTIAKDIILVLKAEGIENYIVFGRSFGTLIGTKVGAMAENMGLKKPRAVVLEGSLGGSPT